MAEELSVPRVDAWGEGRVASVLDGLPEAVLVFDRDLRLVHANAYALNIVGSSLSEAVGKGVWELLPHLQSTVAGQELPRAVQTRTATHFAYHSGLTGRWLDARVFPVGDEWVFHTTDLSEAKAADARLAATTDALPAFVAYVDAGLVYRFCNRRFEEWFGRPKSEIVGKHMREILGDGTFERLEPYLQRALSGEQTEYAQWLDFESGRRFMRGTYTPSFDAEGRVEGLSAMIADATETKENEDRLRASEGRLSLALAAASLGTWDADLTTGITRYSGAAAVIFGRPEAEFSLSMDEVLSLIHPDDLPELNETFVGLLERDTPYHVEFRAHEKDGVWRWVEASGLAGRDANGRAIRVTGVFSDVTARKEAEAELERRVGERTAQLEAARRSQESWNYSVSHDLRAPLRAVMSTSKILQMDFGENLPPEARDLLDRQAAAAKKLGDLIDELLQASRLASQDLILKPLDLSAIAREAAEEQLTHSGRPFDLRIEDGMFGIGDSRLVKLVFSNYLENAMKYSPAETLIKIGRREQAFYVQDQGIGFEMQYEPKLWRPFERLVRDADYAGTGIGLYNVASMVERMGGRVWAESEPGNGSTFWFTLN